MLVFAFTSLIVLFFTLKKAKDPLPILSVLIFATTPIFLHFARINFGQTPSLLFILLGYYLFTKISEAKSLRYAAFSAVAFGLSGYGLGANVIVTPLFVSLLFLFNILTKNKQYRKHLVIFLLTFFVMYLPLIQSFTTNPNFLNRLRDKGKGMAEVSSKKRIIEVIKNYPKYYSFDYLFLKGENNVPGAFIKRHSIASVGILSKTLLPLIVLAFFSFLFFPLARRKEYLPFFSLFLLYPFPDIITTSGDNPPYTVALFATLFCIPFMTSYLFTCLNKLFKTTSIVWKSTVTVVAVFTLLEAVLLLRAYDNYQKFSADYWGWQYGPKSMVKYFLQVNKNYDEIYMTGMFNQPQIFLQFYDPKQQCNNCYIGGVDKYNSSKRQLFALTAEEYNNLTIGNFVIKKVINYPDNSLAFVVGELTPNQIRR
ncbi:hypothetical protein A3J15_01245 [Candidatus Roizmanbacteria bacterium RIFCSPLOWO2_02_FULL_38_10]|uniref:Glycosyltransferase RgtA/B/C/D-like domain-containing protein n=1 Tax=Candidatus Roizmanbacteria bacterium RIFCSPLOWO2_02_FULL_38_10 TaxID=1802074 RepID=A0A1F7JLD0_9BACT|nr:MAG: hypothetical protein A3J15_01245 [Candidatus Roizmanbacteria bacterium RIFCSPLOWO2_02_FULL_38_10]